MAEETPVVLEVENLSHAYETSRTVLKHLHLTLREGDSVAVCGRSGVGKTTLLEILGTMREPTHGTVRLRGESVYDAPVKERSRMRGSYLGFVFQEGHLLPDLSVWENCRLAVILSGRDWGRQRIRERFEWLMDGLGLDPSRGSDRPARFSTGERQRIAVIRALIHRPGLLLADEPTGNLDIETSEQLLDLLFPLIEEDGMGILVATHDPHLAQSLDRNFELEKGSLVPMDSAPELISQ